MTHPRTAPVPAKRRDRLKQLRAFCETARHGGIARAARQMQSSPTTVSIQVRMLEEELGVRLFERRGHRVVLTQVGNNLYRIATPLVQRLLRLPNLFAERYHSVDPAWLSIGAGQVSASALLPGPLKRFQARYPEVRVEVRTGNGHARLDWLRNFDVDVVIASFDVVPPDIEFKPFRTSQFVLVTPEDHPLAGRDSVTLQAAVRYPLVAPVSGHYARQVMNMLLWLRGENPSVAVEVEGWRAILSHVAAGVGVAFVPDMAVTRSVRVRKIALRPRTVYRVYGAATRRNELMASATSWLVGSLVSASPDVIDAR